MHHKASTQPLRLHMQVALPELHKAAGPDDILNVDFPVIFARTGELSVLSPSCFLQLGELSFGFVHGCVASIARPELYRALEDLRGSMGLGIAG